MDAEQGSFAQQRRLFVIKYFLSAALLSLAVVAPANAKSEYTTFEHEGVSYTYKVTSFGENKRVISGYATPGASFRLLVAGNTISGTSNGMPVSFKLSEVKPYTTSKGAVTVASR
jgi:hypothetical protein